MRKIKAFLFMLTVFIIFNSVTANAQNKTNDVIFTIPNTITGIFSSFENDDIQSSNTISYKMPNSTFSINMPKVATMGTITLFNGKFTNCKAFWVFYDNISMNTIMRENIKVQYYINNKKKVLVLKNAWPTNIERNIYRFFRKCIG